MSSLPVQATRRWVTGSRQTLPCVLTAVAGRHSYVSGRHPGKFLRGLGAPMTSALCAGGRNLILMLHTWPGKAICNSWESVSGRAGPALWPPTGVPRRRRPGGSRRPHRRRRPWLRPPALRYSLRSAPPVPMPPNCREQRYARGRAVQRRLTGVAVSGCVCSWRGVSFGRRPSRRWCVLPDP